MFSIPARTVSVYRHQESLALEERSTYVALGYVCSPVALSITGTGSWTFSVSVPANDNSF